MAWSHKKIGFQLLTIAVLITLTSVTSACSGIFGSNPPDPSPYRHDQPYEYYLYLPSQYSEDLAWPVFVGIHGYGGSGRDCWSMWQPYADKEGFLLVCPTLADVSGGWYQSAGEDKLAEILQQVYRDHSIRSHVFIAGFSAGAQFAQGFTFNIPSYVSGVAVLSAGNYYPINTQARPIPFLIVIGDKDDTAAVQGAQSFAQLLQNNGFMVDFHLLPGVDHTVSNEVKQLTIEFFRKIEYP
jgi:poly(3-hydroxybutyrate) depolymerase